MSLIGVRLKELRGPSSQSEMATAVGVKQQNWARWESGTVTPSADMIITICRAHAVSSDWLLGLTDSCCDRRNNYAKATSGGIAIVGNVNRVSVPMVSGVDYGNAAACAKCPFKKKLKALEKVLGVGGGERK